MGIFDTVQGTRVKITRYIQKYGGVVSGGETTSMFITFDNPAMTDEKIEKFRKLLVKRYAYNDYDRTVWRSKVCTRETVLVVISAANPSFS